jgi:hypothetical protein
MRRDLTGGSAHMKTKQGRMTAMIHIVRRLPAPAAAVLAAISALGVGAGLFLLLN